MAQIKDRNNKAEKIEVETSLGRSDPNIYFQQLPENPQTQLDIDAPAGRMTEGMYGFIGWVGALGHSAA